MGRAAGHRMATIVVHRPGRLYSGGDEPLSIAVQWVVFSESSSEGIVATGITGKPSAVRWMVEAILTDVRNAGWAEVRRVPVRGEVATEEELTRWPPPGEVYLCRRATGGGFKWLPLCSGPGAPTGQIPGISDRVLHGDRGSLR
jgi:hypothetical protein